MAALMIPTGTAPQFRPSTRQRHDISRVLGVVLIVFALFGAMTMPVHEVIPEPVTAAISAVVPDFVEDLLTADEAHAWGWLKQAAKTVSYTVTGGVFGAAAGCGAGAMIGMVVASGFGCAAGAAIGGTGSAIGGFYASFR